MFCHVVVNDYEIGQRMFYILGPLDFNNQESSWNDNDPVLDILQNNEAFRGRTKWSDLDLEHFHLMIINMLKILATMDDAVRSNKDSAPVGRLAFFFCSLIRMLEERTGSHIELLHVNRVSSDDVVYDYTATLDMPFSIKSSPKLKVMSDEDDN